jgi:hypothetical protein
LLIKEIGIETDKTAQKIDSWREYQDICYNFLDRQFASCTVKESPNKYEKGRENI